MNRYLLHKRPTVDKSRLRNLLGPDFDNFAQVYRDAAAQLAGTRTDGGLWALPIVFLYRHALELTIKAILTRAGSDAGIDPKCVLNRSHNLKKQLPDLVSVAKWSGVELTPEFTELIAAWDEEDSTGMVARYPVRMDGKRQELQNADAFDLKSLVDECESVLDELRYFLVEVEWQIHCGILQSEAPRDPES